MKTSLKLFKKYLPFFGLILFIIILTNVNFEKIWSALKNISPLHLIIAGLLTPLILTNKAICWNYIKKCQGIKYGLKDSILMYCSGLFIGFITPGRLGEFSKSLYLKNDGYPLGKSLVNIILDKLSDLVILLLVLFFSLSSFFSLLKKPFLILFPLLAVFVLLLIIFLKTKLVKKFFKKTFYLLIPLKYKKSFEIILKDFTRDIKIYKLKNYLIILFITAFSWLFYYLQTYTLAQGLNINVPFLYLTAAVTIAGLITLIPLSISGIGTRDAALIFLFAPFLIPKEQVIIFSALILLMSLFAALIGLVSWFIKPTKILT